MAVSITIRDVPEATRDELAARAAQSGRSLQEYLRGRLIALAEKPDIEAVVAAMAERKRQTTSHLSADKILEYRDDDRR